MSKDVLFGKQAYSFFTGKVIVNIINLLLVILMARVLGSDLYGVFSLSNTFIVILYTVFNFGLENAIVYYIPVYQKKGKQEIVKNLLDTIVIIRVITGLIGFTVLFFASDALEALYGVTDLSNATKIAGIGFFGYSIVFLAPSIFQSFKRFELSKKTDVINSVIKASLVIATISFGFIPVMIGHSSALLISGVILLIIFYKKVMPKKPLKKELIIKSIKLVSKYSLISYSGTIAYLLITSLGDLLVGSVPMEVSFLNIGHKLGYFIILPATAISSVLFPNISGLVNKEEIKKYYLKATRYITLITTILSLSVIVFGTDIMKYLLGDSYTGAKPVINLMMIGYLIYTASLSMQTLYSGINKPSKTTKAIIIQAVISLVLLLALTPTLKSYGAGIAFMISNIAFFAYLLINTLKDGYGYNFNYLTRISLTGLLSLSAYFISNFYIKTIVFAAVFITAGIAIKAIKKEDLKLLLNINKKNI